MSAILLALAMLSAEVTQADIEAYALRAKVERPKVIAAGKKEMIAVRRNRQLDSEEKRAKLASIKSRMQAASNRKSPFYPPLGVDLSDELPHGHYIGWLNSSDDNPSRFRCQQVVDEMNCTVEFVSHNYQYRRTADGQYARDGQTESTKLYWLSGVPTKDFVDGDSIELRGVFAITGTKRYDTTNGGTQTVPLIEYVDIAPHANKFRVVK